MDTAEMYPVPPTKETQVGPTPPAFTSMLSITSELQPDESQCTAPVQCVQQDEQVAACTPAALACNYCSVEAL